MEGRATLTKALQFTGTIIHKDTVPLSEAMQVLPCDEISEIYRRLDNPSRKDASGKLKNAVDALIVARAKYDDILEKVKSIIDPNVQHVRQSAQEIARLARENAIKDVATSIRKNIADEKKLRVYAEMMLGDSQLDYTFEELPMAIARKQVGE